MMPQNHCVSLCLLAAVCLLGNGASAGLAPSLKPTTPSLPKKPDLDPEDVVRFTKNLYRDLGASWNNTSDVTDKYRPAFRQLNESTAGMLGQTLSSLLEIRMLDLQASVRHARKMRTVVESFAEKRPVDEPI
jgi:hypothetical protein